MDAIDRMIDHDLWLTRQLLNAAGGLPADELAEPFEVTPGVPYDFPHERPTVVGRPDRMGAARTLNASSRP